MEVSTFISYPRQLFYDIITPTWCEKGKLRVASVQNIRTIFNNSWFYICRRERVGDIDHSPTDETLYFLLLSRISIHTSKHFFQRVVDFWSCRRVDRVLCLAYLAEIRGRVRGSVADIWEQYLYRLILKLITRLPRNYQGSSCWIIRYLLKRYMLFSICLIAVESAWENSDYFYPTHITCLSFPVSQWEKES